MSYDTITLVNLNSAPLPALIAACNRIVADRAKARSDYPAIYGRKAGAKEARFVCTPSTETAVALAFETLKARVNLGLPVAV